LIWKSKSDKCFYQNLRGDPINSTLSPERNINLLLSRLSEIRSTLSSRDVSLLANNTGASFEPGDSGKGVFHLPVWGDMIDVTCPDFIAYPSNTLQPLNAVLQGLILYHFLTADGTPESGSLISFSELPDGRFYTQAFHGYTGGELVRNFKDNLTLFRDAAVNQAGIPLRLGDAAFTFRLFPNVTLAAVCWLGDEDFPTNYQILFDASIIHHLPTDACAIAGSLLTKKIINAGKAVSR
jgi:hypothetical protein